MGSTGMIFQRKLLNGSIMAKLASAATSQKIRRVRRVEALPVNKKPQMAAAKVEAPTQEVFHKNRSFPECPAQARQAKAKCPSYRYRGSSASRRFCDTFVACTSAGSQ